MIRTGTTVKTRKSKSGVSNMLSNRLLMSLLALFIIGMVYGAFMVPYLEDRAIELVDFMAQGFIASRAEQSIFITLFTSLSTPAVMLSIIFASGLSAIGQPLSFFILFFRGLGLGLSMGNFYTAHGGQGIVYCLVLILPHALLSTFSLLIGAKESVRFSNLFFQCFLSNKENPISKNTLKLYISKFLILLVLIFLAAVLDCITTFLFAQFFKF